MSELIIIAGPQAAGKSSAIAKLSEHYRSISPLFGKRTSPLLFPLQESRQIIVHMHMLLGAIFMGIEHECEVVQCDYKRMDKLAAQKSNRIVYLDECNVFTIAHAKAHGMNDIQSEWDSYIRRLRILEAKVIFLDIPPAISWERRRLKYEERLIYFFRREHKQILARYEDYLKNIHPLLHEIYDRLPLPKRMIDARQSNKRVIEEVGNALAKLSTTFA